MGKQQFTILTPFKGFVATACFSTSDTFARMHLINLQYNLTNPLVDERLSSHALVGNNIKVMVGFQGICSKDMTAVDGVTPNTFKGELLCSRTGNINKLHTVSDITIYADSGNEYVASIGLYAMAKSFTRHSAFFGLIVTTCIVNCIALLIILMGALFPINHNNIISYFTLLFLVIQGMISLSMAIVISAVMYVPGISVSADVFANSFCIRRSFSYTVGQASFSTIICRGRAMPIGMSWLATIASLIVSFHVLVIYYRNKDDTMTEVARRNKAFPNYEEYPAE